MYKVLIVCQSSDKADMIYKAVLQTTKSIEIIRVESSEEALGILDDKSIDVAFISIEMPNINGIELASIVREKNNNTHIVFMSDYDNFEFLRKSLQLGVDDYFLEKILEADVVDVMSKLCDKIDNERIVINKAKDKDKEIEDMHSLVGSSFIYSILFNGKMTQEIELYKEVLGLYEKGLFFNIEIDNNYNKFSLDKINIREDIERILKGQCTFVIGPRLLNRVVVYISVDEENEDNCAAFSENIAKKIIYLLEKEYSINVNIGIGSVQLIDKSLISYEESLECLRGDIDKQINFISEQKDTDNVALKRDIIEAQKRLIECIELGKEDVLDEFMGIVKFISKWNVEEKKNKYIEILVLSCYTVNKMGLSECAYVDYSMFYEEFRTLEDSLIDAWAMNKFQYIIKSARKHKTDNMSEIIKTAIYYMYEHYDENISLNDIAGLVGVSLQYFSKIFKDETGKNYVEWLNRFRIDKAKDLMSETQLTIKEVCFKVGYNDPNYFSRIFKKYEGVAPTEYINKKE